MKPTKLEFKVFYFANYLQNTVRNTNYIQVGKNSNF